MAKPIYVPQDEAARIIEALREQIFNSKCYGRIDIQQSFKSDDRRALLYFTPMAWIKMTALVSEFTSEVQWHGLVRRLSEFEFEIYDIIVPPHTVTAVTVTSDQEKYSEWINGLDDETFNALRFHGHSHVNMEVSPSVTDKDYRKDVITQLPKPDENNDTFYIFLIINKRHDWSAEIYDLTYNALYSTTSKEIDIMVLLEDGDTVDNFVIEAKKVAVSAPASSGKVIHGGYGSSYGGSVRSTNNQNSSNSYNSKGSENSNKTPAVSGTEYNKKNDIKTKSEKDDRDDYYGVDEDPTDPFFARDGWWWR